MTGQPVKRQKKGVLETINGPMLESIKHNGEFQFLTSKYFSFIIFMVCRFFLCFDRTN